MLYPPYIEGTIPSFYGDSITVPFSMNKAVGLNEIQGFSLKLKTIQNTKFLFTTESVIEYDNYSVKFNIADYSKKLKIGQHYKLQIAYIGNDGVGYYSTVGIIKYTTKPKVSIEGLKSGRINSSAYNYIGTYSQESQDITEKEYKYNFIFSDSAGSVLSETGWLIHNNSNDDKNYLSHDEFLVPFDLDKDQTYYLQYKVLTNNKMEVSSPKYRITQQQSIESDNSLELFAELHRDNGYVQLALKGERDKSGAEQTFSGDFLISRACENTNYKTWEEVLRFKARNLYPSNWSTKDFTVEQGRNYIYSIQQYNDFGLYSERILSNEVFADFDDMFLYDGEKQLKIAYNPQVSSFKINVLERKTDTIGSKYAFFSRNGNVEYKEFNLKGLISYLADEENLFLSDKELGLLSNNFYRKGTVLDDTLETLYKYKDDITRQDNLQENYEQHKKDYDDISSMRLRTTQLTSFNFSAERIFKLAVLEWLNNGKPKLFRSPGEGNYIVRLMGASLTPEDTLGRLLHNFSCTAYEVDEYNHSTLNKYDIIKITAPETEVLRFKTVLITPTTENLIDTNYAVTIKFEGMTPGDEILIQTDQGGQSIFIGPTGTYQIESKSKILSAHLSDLTVKRMQKMNLNNPMITYSYYETSSNSFNDIVNITFDDFPAQQFIGKYENIFDEINNIKEVLTSFHYLHFYSRDIESVNVNFFYNTTKNQYDFSLDLEQENNYQVYSFIVPCYENYWGFVQKELTERDFYLPDEAFKETNIYKGDFDKYNYRYFTRTDEGVYVPATSWNEENIYYIKKDLTLYYDKGQYYFDQESYDRIYEDLNDLDKEKFQVYNNKICIDNNELDLKETNDYDIKGPILFNSIKLSVGTVLECGYNLRTKQFQIETMDNELINLKKDLDSLYQMILNEIKEGIESKEKIERYYNNKKIYLDLLTQKQEEVI